jgi:hypothetical protein
MIKDYLIHSKKKIFKNFAIWVNFFFNHVWAMYTKIFIELRLTDLLFFDGYDQILIFIFHNTELSR